MSGIYGKTIETARYVYYYPENNYQITGLLLRLLRLIAVYWQLFL